MLTTRFVDGAPNWLDLATPDMGGAQAFYRDLFGWDYRLAGPDAGGYGMFRLNGKVVAGGMTVDPDQGPPAWSIFFQSSDADTTAQAAEDAGGSVRFKPMDVMDQGRMAVLADPAGTPFGVWQPAANKGLDTVNEKSALCWTELYTPDVQAAAEFFGSALGWTTEEMPYSGGTYTIASPAGGGEDAGFGGLVPLSADPRASTPYWLPYFAVPDADAARGRVQELGGRALGTAVDIEDVGRIAQLADPYGARFAVLAPSGR
ncbi:hydroxylase [Streptomyces sulfonofaciens]|uniref:Hydroxylase n=1 Tax=Streptomyces sulfonofaciens TaxID=68272 RepID=A0A919GDC4_9ACTN|nr:VOC family protein [Streptomyces sulfonofaciens]GHH82532.1 hydroxylase [Streptomyces sulfonofaciens]